ncbi:MAG: NAD(P)/FAD-dependent oxidoreductase [Campylobacterota bacterium]|nr:NAD(P)/FAD-dependent oxidoreductase [Campylobacterota bacterium]
MKKVVILGGGYSGVYALKELVKNQDIQITLIDKHTYHNLQPEVYDLIANKANIADVTIDLSSLCSGFDHPYLEYKNLRVTDIDFDLNIISTQENETVSYDYLILAMGTRTFFPKNIEGLNNTDDIKKLHRAIYFKQSFEKVLFNKIEDEAKKCIKTHIAVVGAGLSGVEISAEMANYAKEFFKRGNFACDDLKISLISSASSVLPGFDPKMIRMSQTRLKELNINIITNTKMTSCDKEYLYLSNGTKIAYSFIIFAGGIKASNITTKLNLEKNSKNQIIVDEYLQTKYKNVFAIGDIAQIKNKEGNIMPANVTVARATGISVGKNILNHIENKKLKSCNPKLEGTLIALGGKYAVCDLYGLVQVKGFLGYCVKQYVFLRYKIPLLKYIKVGYEKLKKHS